MCNLLLLLVQTRRVNVRHQKTGAVYCLVIVLDQQTALLFGLNLRLRGL